ncbi:MAG: hypothetical protein LBR10_01605, partial [Prevotellaceae bacterium]|nr:hypothetical protein [Prevotellaceae bacterium]
MNKQTVTKYTGIISLSSILGLELLLANALTFSDCGEIWGNQMKCILFFVCITGLIASTVVNIIYSAIHPGKLKGVIKTLIKNSVSGNVLDILFVIFFLLHLTWIPDAVFEWIKEDFCWVHPFIFLSGMIIATLLKP